MSINMPATLNILIVATDLLVQRGAAMLLHTQPTWLVQTLRHDQVDELRRLATKPDIALVSIDGLTSNDAHCIRKLKKAVIRVVAYGSAGSPGLVRNTITIGADAFVDTGTSAERIIATIATCAAGRHVVVTGNETQQILAEVSHAQSLQAFTPSSLTNREQELLAYIAQGLTNSQIAECLHIKVGTVKSHVTRMLRKYGFSSRTQLAMLTNPKREFPTANV